MSILDNYYGEGKSIRDKITELEEENKTLYKKLQEIGENNFELKEKIRKLSEGKIIYASEKEQRHYVDILEENKNLKLTLEQMENTCKDYLNDRDTLREENRKLKLHIEAKDKAYTALLKDYEEIKEDRDRMKKRVKEHIIYSIKAEFIKKFYHENS